MQSDMYTVQLGEEAAAHLVCHYRFALPRERIGTWLQDLRATPVGLLNGLSYLYLLGGCKKLISSRPSKWVAILVGLQNFSPTPLIWWLSIWAANYGPSIEAQFTQPARVEVYV